MWVYKRLNKSLSIEHSALERVCVCVCVCCLRGEKSVLVKRV